MIVSEKHTPGLKRLRTDDELRKWSVEGLYDLAAACEIEPADPTICDACAAYLIAHEKEGAEKAEIRAQDYAGSEWAGGAAVAADWMARAMVAEAAVAELMEDRARQRPWLFVPGDKVIVLYGNKMEGGTVTRVQMPGPIREDNTVFVEMEDVATGQLHQSMWFDPDQVERIVP